MTSSNSRPPTHLLTGLKPLSTLILMSGMLVVSGCSMFSHKSDPVTVPKTADAETLYNYGIDALHSKRYELASGEFELLQQNYPYSGFTGNAELMEGYAHYLRGEYALSVQQLERYLQLHPTSPDAAYAFYLRALCYYEQIADVQRDQQGTVEAMNALEEVVTRFPQTAYARDAQLKIDLCRDHLAGKEMLVGRWYQQQRNYEAAMTRYQRVVQDFQTTNHTAEALERLVEVYLALGLKDQAHQTAAVLGYNYPDSAWYRNAYKDLQQAGILADDIKAPTSPSRSKDSTTTPPSSKGFVSRTLHKVF